MRHRFLLIIVLSMAFSPGCSKEQPVPTAGQDANGAAQTVAQAPSEHASAGPLTFQVNSLETKESYQYRDNDYRNPSGIGQIIANAGQALVVVNLTVQNGGQAWETFSSTSFQIVDQAGNPLDARFIGFANTVSMSGSMVMEDWSSVSVNGENLVKYRGRIDGNDPNKSLFDWQVGPGKTYTEVFVFVIPAQTQDVGFQVAKK